MVDYLCRKVRSTTGAYLDMDGKSSPARCFEVHLVPVSSQHGTPGGVADLKLWVWTTCPYQEGQVYRLNL